MYQELMKDIGTIIDKHGFGRVLSGLVDWTYDKIGTGKPDCYEFELWQQVRFKLKVALRQWIDTIESATER